MEVQKETYFPKLEAIEQSATTLQEVVAVTPLQENSTYLDNLTQTSF